MEAEVEFEPSHAATTATNDDEREALSPPFATERFASDAQLFEREAPKAGSAHSTRGGWAYSGLRP